MTIDNEYWENYGEYDSAMNELKDALRASVKDEVKKRIENLELENRTLKVKLQGLDKLELEAAQAKSKYEREFSEARRVAERTVRKEELGKLLQALDERLYTVERLYVKRDKCELCDDDRRLKYTTPSGREAYEMCECAANDSSWEVQEVVAHEVSRRDGKLMVWWRSLRSWGEDDQISPRVLKPSEGVEVSMMQTRPMEYSFRDLASAQVVADALNADAESK